jgi:hypothetical protein
LTEMTMAAGNVGEYVLERAALKVLGGSIG